MLLGALAAIVVAIGMLVIYDRGYAAAANRYESTYREAIDKHRAEQARERGAEVLRDLRTRVQRNRMARLGKVSW